MNFATHRGVLPVGDLELPCFVIDDGTRVISGRGMTTAIGMRGRGAGVRRIAAHPSFRDYIAEGLRDALNNPISFLPSERATRPYQGYEATILLQVCETILTAHDKDALDTDQELRYAAYCNTLVRAFAKVGIIALVDEATGYQDPRDRDALSRILQAYISEELMPWTKRFPDAFYQELFRLRGWRYSPVSVARPQVVGNLTNELVYNRLPPGVLDELRRLNPVVDKTGHRAKKHHQYLTDDIGNRHLEKHMAAVIAVMRLSSNWATFKRHFERAFPRGDVQEELDLGDV